MTDFDSEIRQRVASTWASIIQARQDGDDYLASVLDGELESLRRLAREHAVATD